MKQTFLLQEVIDDLVNTEKSLSSPLMKLNYFGRLVKNQELIDYTQNELNLASFSTTSIISQYPSIIVPTISLTGRLVCLLTL